MAGTSGIGSRSECKSLTGRKKTFLMFFFFSEMYKNIKVKEIIFVQTNVISYNILLYLARVLARKEIMHVYFLVEYINRSVQSLFKAWEKALQMVKNR